MSRGTTNVAPPLRVEVGQGPSDGGRPLTATQNPWSEDWRAPERRDLARKHSLAQKRERLLARRGHSTPLDLEALESMPDPDDVPIGTGGVFSKLGVVVATFASAYWYYTITIASIAIAVPLAIGWSTSTVATGSMEPAMSPGDVVAYADYDGSDLPIGSIIRFEDPARPGQTVTHRVSGVNGDGTFETRGDANPQPDSAAVPRSTVTGVARIVTPHAGLPQVWVGSENWTVFTIWVAITVGAGMTVGLYGRSASEPLRRRRGILRPALAAGLIAAFAGVGTAAWSSAAFAAQEGNDGSTFSSAAEFPAQPPVGGATCAVGTSTVIALTQTIDAGSTVVIRYSLRDRSTDAPLAASDTSGNTYTVDAHAINGTRAEAAILSAHVATTLGAGDEITVTHPEGAAVALVVDVFSDIATVDRVSASEVAFGHTKIPVVTATTVDGNTRAIGSIVLQRSAAITQPPGWSSLTGGAAACGKTLTHGAASTTTVDPGAITYDPPINKKSRFAAVLVIYNTNG